MNHFSIFIYDWLSTRINYPPSDKTHTHWNIFLVIMYTYLFSDASYGVPGGYDVVTLNRLLGGVEKKI